MGGTAKDSKENILIELMRYIQLQRDDWDMSNEFDLAIYSVWYLLNPLGVEGRSKMVMQYPKECEDIDGKYVAKFEFTSHSHHNEPLKPSVEDIIIYRRSPERFSAHFLTDRFNIHRVDIRRDYDWINNRHKPDNDGKINIEF